MSSGKFLIEGTGGERTLNGEVGVGGAKNAVIKAIASTALFDEAVTFENVPDIEDVSRMFELLRALGVNVDYDPQKHSARVDPSGIKSTDIDVGIAKRLRASVVATGPLLARFGRVTFPMPGGCVLGARPIDQFERGFKKMGVDVCYDNSEERYEMKVRGGKLKGADIFFTVQTHTGTETLMMAATLAEGTTVLRNAAMEPEIVHLADFLNSSGADIKGAGSPTITINGTGGTLLKATRTYETLPDRIEAGSLLILGSLLANHVKINNCNPNHLNALIELLLDSGVDIKVNNDSIDVSAGTQKTLSSINLKTHEYPGFPTDLQAPMVVYLTQTRGEAVVFETIFESRLNYVDDLITMGADIKMWDAQRIMIKGPTPLKGRDLTGPDIRTGFAFIIAALCAKGESTIDNIYYVDRGYERIESKLRRIGAEIKRIE